MFSNFKVSELYYKWLRSNMGHQFWPKKDSDRLHAA